MRPIDADAAIVALGECPYNWCDEREEIQAVADWRSTRKMLNELPTLEVIPVEWLKKVREDADDAGDWEMGDSITCLLEEWKRCKNARQE